MSCSKIFLVDVFPDKQLEQFHRFYAILDDQSKSSLIAPELAHSLGASGPKEKYLLSTCNSDEEKYGRRATGLFVKSMEGHIVRLPTLVEYECIPQDKTEMPTPQITKKFPHLTAIADHIPALDSNAKIQVLIGRDVPELLKIRPSKSRPKGAP